MECQCNCIGSNVRQSNLGTTVQSICVFMCNSAANYVTKIHDWNLSNLWGCNFGGPIIWSEIAWKYRIKIHDWKFGIWAMAFCATVKNCRTMVGF
jgi:hypothetical protein